LSEDDELLLQVILILPDPEKTAILLQPPDADATLVILEPVRSTPFAGFGGELVNVPITL
jgi:hypothetical protein